MGIGKFARLSDSDIHELAVRIKADKHDMVCNDCLWPNSCPCSMYGKLSRNVIIESFIPLALAIARRRYLPGNRMEMQSLSLYYLTVAVNKTPQLKNIENIGAYVRKFITKKLAEYMLVDGVILLDRNSAKKYKHLHSIITLTENTCRTFDHDYLDTNELIDKIPESKTEKIIVKCLVEGGYTNKDIAAMCRVSAPRISQIKSKIIEKFSGILLKGQND